MASLAQIEKAIEEATADGNTSAVAELEAMRTAKIEEAIAAAKSDNNPDAVAELESMLAKPTPKEEATPAGGRRGKYRDYQAPAREDIDLPMAAAEEQAPVEQALPGSQAWGESVMARGTALLDGLTAGWGQQVAAGGRTAVGQLLDAIDPRLEMEDWGTRYERERERGERAMEIERQNAPGTMLGLTVAGALPTTMKLSAMVPNQATRIGNVAAQGGVGAAEGLSYELGKTRGDIGKKLENIDPVGPALGLIGGGVGGAFMSGTASQAARAERLANRTEDGFVTQQAFNDDSRAEVWRRRVIDDLYENVRVEVGEGSARQLSKADFEATMAKQDLHAADRLPPEAIRSVSKAFEANPAAIKMYSNANAVSKSTGKPILSPRGRVAMLDKVEAELAKTDPAAAEAFGRMRGEIKMLQDELQQVFPGVKFEEGYAPIQFNRATQGNTRMTSRSKRRGPSSSDTTTARTTGVLTEAQAAAMLENPVASFMNFYEEVTDALAMARAYDVQVPKKTEIESIGNYSEEVINAIAKKVEKEGGKEAADRLAEHLSLFALDGREGMSPLLQFARTVTSTSLLATPENAMLQLGDLGAGAYHAGLKNALKALPLAIRSVLTTSNDVASAAGKKSSEAFLRAPDIGISMQHLGELVNTSGGWASEVANGMSMKLMGWAGVRRMNRMGQETVINAAVNDMKGMSRQQLGNSKWAEGLPAEEVDVLFDALKAGNVQHPAIKEAAFFATSRIQPISRTAQPPQYLQMRNGRVLYNMKQYMTKMASRMHNDVFKPYDTAVRAGFNTAEGQAALRKATLNSAKYMGFIVALNALVDPGRKEIFRGKESENTFGQEMLRQGTSIATAGWVDTSRDDILEPPPTLAPLNQGYKALVEQMSNDDWDPSYDELMNMGLFIPGFRQFLWADQVMNPEVEFK